MPSFKNLSTPDLDDIVIRYDMLRGREAAFVYMNEELVALFVVGLLVMTPGRRIPRKNIAASGNPGTVPNRMPTR